MEEMLRMTEDIISEIKKDIDEILEEARNDFAEIVYSARKFCEDIIGVYEDEEEHLELEEILDMKADELYDAWQVKLDDILDLQGDAVDELLFIQEKKVDYFCDRYDIDDVKYQDIADAIHGKICVVEEYVAGRLKDLEECHQEHLNKINEIFE